MKKNTKIIGCFLLTALTFILLYAQPYHLGSCHDSECYLYFLNRLTPFFRGYKPNDIVLFRYNEKIKIGHIMSLDGKKVEIILNNIDISSLNHQAVITIPTSDILGIAW